jgi:hypothetical protein
VARRGGGGGYGGRKPASIPGRCHQEICNVDNETRPYDFFCGLSLNLGRAGLGFRSGKKKHKAENLGLARPSPTVELGNQAKWKP